MKDAFDAAFPHDTDSSEHFGLSRRELFAAMAMQGLLAQGRTVQMLEDKKAIARMSVDMAVILCDILDKTS